MPRKKVSRKARFKAALAIEGTTQKAWAEKNGVTPEHLSFVLAGTRESKVLTEKVDAYIEDVQKRFPIAA